MKPFLSVIIKPTLSCDAECIHCYHRSSECDDTVINETILKKTFRMVHDEYGSARYLWTGGEPLIVGEKFFKKAITFQKELYDKAFGRCGNTIQTNGVRLNQRFMDFCRSNSINLGISYEGGFDEGLRPNIDKDAVEKQLNLLSKKGHMFSVISNIHSGNLSKMHQMYDYFTEKNITFYYSPVIKSCECVNNELYLNPKEYAEACISVFDRWIRDIDVNVPVLPFYQYARASLSSPNISDCNHSSCLTNWICVYPNGDVYPCSKPCPPEYKMGNISEVESIQELFSSNGFAQILKDSIERRNKCKECPIFGQCAGGCTLDAYNEGNAKESGFFSCEYYKIVYPHIEKTIKEIIDKKKDLSNYNKFVRDLVIGKLTNPNVVVPIDV